MDQDVFSYLMEISDPDEQERLKTLHASFLEVQAVFKAEQTTANLKDLMKAQRALEDFEKEVKAKYLDAPREFKSLPDVIEYLADEGWKIKKSTAYLHLNEGKLRRQKDGTFTLADVERYAAAHLRKFDSGQSEALDNLQMAKLSAEIRKTEAQARDWDLRSKIRKGYYVHIDDYERDLAGRANVIKSDLENFARSKGSQIIDLVMGSHEKIIDLEEYLIRQFENMLHRYSDKKEFKTTLVDEKDDTEDQEQ